MGQNGVTTFDGGRHSMTDAVTRAGRAATSCSRTRVYPVGKRPRRTGFDYAGAGPPCQGFLIRLLVRRDSRFAVGRRRFRRNGEVKWIPDQIPNVERNGVSHHQVISAAFKPGGIRSNRISNAPSGLFRWTRIAAEAVA